MRAWVLAAMTAALLCGAAAPSPPPSARTQEQGGQAGHGKAAEKTQANGTQSLSAYEREALAVDRAANRFAEEANGISRDQTGLGLWSLVLTAVAATAAIAAAVYAKHAADSARAMLKHDQTVDEVQVRPYVYVTSETVEVVKLNAGLVGDHAPVVFKIKNFGQTPAKRVRMQVAAFVGGYWSEDFASNFESAATIELADLPPGFDRLIDGFAVNGLSQTYAAILMDNRSIILDGLIEYEDAAGKGYTTQFRRACTGSNLWGGVFFITREGNEAT